MRDDPKLNPDVLSDALAANYGLFAASITFLPLGYDANAAVYRVEAVHGSSYFLKVRFGPNNVTGLNVATALVDHGISHILAPLPTRSSTLWCSLEPYSGLIMVLYPFLAGENASVVGLSGSQWWDFGATLRAVHDSGLHDVFRNHLRQETFDLRSAGLVHQIKSLTENGQFVGHSRQAFGAWWRQNAGRIDRVLSRADDLKEELQSATFANVLCHADIHAANILVDRDGRINLIDWDSPVLAPRERDLLFVIGSTIARVVEPWEEARFFEGYGTIDVNQLALVYYRYERVIEDLGEFGKSVLLHDELSDEAVDDATRIVASFFEQGGMVERAEIVPTRQLFTGH